MKRLSLLLFALFTALLLLGVFLWHGRVKLVSRMVDRALARQGVDDLSYRLTWLTPWRLVLRDLRWGSESDPLLVVDRIDLRYSIGDLKRGHLERAHVQGAWSVAVELTEIPPGKLVRASTHTVGPLA